jgi:ribosomal protein S18 acetylase RimI-like enzyme
MGETRWRQHAGALAFRPIRPEDEDFLYELYASTRRDELAHMGWTDAEREAFLRMQFTAQHWSYVAQFPAGDFQVILWHDHPIGRLYLDRRRDEMRGIDIALLPAYRQAGIGTAIMQDLLDEVACDGKPFRLHVVKSNRARRLYERLGFTTLQDDGVCLFMEWTAHRSKLTKAEVNRPE